MKKMFWLFGLLAMVGVLFVACADEPATAPEDASFKKVENNCSAELQIQLDAIDDEIDEVLMHRPSRRGAHQILDNIARKVCAEPPDYESTYNMVMDFEALLDRQPPDQIEGGQAAADRLLAAVSAFASGITVPPGALELTGAVGVVEPGTDDVVITENEEAAIVVDPASFDGDEPVTIILTRLSDADTPIPGFTNFAERYEVFVSRSPSETGNGVLVAVCVPDDQELPDELALGHLVDGVVEVLVPVPVGGVLDCTDAETGFPLLASTSGFFALAHLVQPVMDRFLEVKPLHAIYFAGTGLGGRTKSFSPVVPIDPTIDVGESIQLTVGTDADWSSDNPTVATVDNEEFPGLVYGVAAGTATITAEISEVESYSILITVEGETTTSFAVAPLALVSSGDQDVVTVTPAPPAGSQVEVVDVRGVIERKDTLVFPDGSGTVGVPRDLTFEPRSLTANFLGAPGFLPSSSTTATQHVVQRFDDQGSFEAFLGGSLVLTQDFEALDVGTPISNLIPGRLDMTSPFATLEVWAGCTASQGAFGLDGTTRIAGDGRYDMVFTEEPSNALAFDIGAQDPATGPALVDVNTSVGSVSLSVLNPGPTENDPVYLGVAATLDLLSVVVNEGVEVGGGPGNEEVCIDNIAIANTLIPPLL